MNTMFACFAAISIIMVFVSLKYPGHKNIMLINMHLKKKNRVLWYADTVLVLSISGLAMYCSFRETGIYQLNYGLFVLFTYIILETAFYIAYWYKNHSLFRDEKNDDESIEIFKR